MSQTEPQRKFKVIQKITAKKKEILNDVLPLLIKFLSDYLHQVNGILNFENPDQFEDFGPVLLSGEEDKHTTRIKYAITNPSILNLALSGPMGSGKSTVLRTFEHNYPQYKCLNISLATFDQKTLDTDKIEHNILKQLFYSVEHRKIPESRFKRIENLRGIKFKTILFVFWLCSVYYFLKADLLDELKNTLHLDFYSRFWSVIYGVYFASYSFILIFTLMRFILNFKLTKFKIKDVDFDNNQDKKTVNFENEIDEILYFFERNPVDVVFFQDLDRFRESTIFIKLREINNLINNYEPIKKKRKITFIYAVCDDVFKENERAKFFDFIIPVVPVINYTSSSSKLLFKLRDDIQNKKLTRDFIDDVSLFLNDYRTIKSIFNEYQIYKSIIGRQLDNYNNLLAMMIYKNIEPTDFDKLNLNQGYVYAILENVKELKVENNQKLTARSAEVNSKITIGLKEHLKDIQELRMIYILKFVELNLAKNNHAVFGFNQIGNRLTIEDLLKDEFFESFRKEINISYYYSQYNSQGSNISFSEIDKQVNRLSYAQRLQIIVSKEAENLSKLKAELLEIDASKKELDSKKLHEILKTTDSSAYFDKYKEQYVEINNFKLLNYLLAGGFINEDYNHYISYFHPGSIAKEDNDFLLSFLPSERALAYSHKLKELDSLFKRIKPENFSKEAILNFSLIDYLIQNKKAGRLGQVFNLLSKGTPKTMTFTDGYLDYANEADRAIFFKVLAGIWIGLWTYILTKSNFSKDKIETYLTYTFKYLDQETASKLDQSRRLSAYISGLEHLDCFIKSADSIAPFKEFLMKSTVKFENLIYVTEHTDLFEFIYDNNLYMLNERMITLFISNFNINNIDVKKLKTSNYTTIKKSGRVKLIKYIDNNLELYLENVFLKLDNNFEESQENLIAILNNEVITNRFDIVEYGKFSIDDLSKITSTEIQAALIIYGKIAVDWKNVLAYYKKVGAIDGTLIDYLDKEEYCKKLSKQGLIKDEDENVRSSFPKALIRSAVSNKSLAELTINLPFNYRNAEEFADIHESKMESLIRFGRIQINVGNYLFIKEKFNNLLILLIEANAEVFVKDIEEYIVESPIMLKVLSSEKLTAKQKSEVIEKSSFEVLTGNGRLMEELAGFLSIHTISTMTFDFLDQLISNTESNEIKVKLTSEYFSSIEESKMRSVVAKIDEFSKLLEGRRPKVANTSSNLKLVEKLEGSLVSTKRISSDLEYIKLYPYKTKK